MRCQGAPQGGSPISAAELSISRLTGAGNLVWGIKVTREVILNCRSDHENPSMTSAQHKGSSGQMSSLTEVCPLIPQRPSVHVTPSLPFTPFHSLHSISTAGHGCGHATWGLTLLSSPHSWLPTPASLGAAPATAHVPITPAWQHPIAASSPHDTSGDSC